MTWDDERYYLVAHYEKYPGKLTNFRVDRMESVEVIDVLAHEMPKDFNLSAYLNSTFSMFSGEAQDVKLRFDNSLINPVIDRFGKDITIIPDGAEHFTVRVKVKAESPFFGWLFQFGTKVQIVEPVVLKEKYLNMLRDVLKHEGIT